MTKGVLIIREEVGEDKDFLVQVASTGLGNAIDCLGDRVVLYRPRDNEPGRYVGLGTVADVLSHRDTHLTFLIEGARFFTTPLLLAPNQELVEAGLGDAQGKVKFQRLAPGLRHIAGSTYLDILRRAEEPAEDGAVFSEESVLDSDELKGGVLLQAKRQRVELRYHCLKLYRRRCMLSGRELDVPEGFSLLEVSHFRALCRNGPDVITNAGLKTPTIHKMYEAGLVTIGLDYKLRFAPDLTMDMRLEFRGREEAELPRFRRYWPDPEHLHFHNTRVFEARLRRLDHLRA